MAAKDIPGRAAYLWIYDEWIKSEPREGAVVVEVGVALGRSIAALCEMLDEAGRDDIRVYGVDPWDGTHRNGEQQLWAVDAGGDFALYARTMLKYAPKAFQRVRTMRVTGVEAARMLRGAGTDVDCVVLDGDHAYETVRNEIVVWHRVMRNGSVMGGDDFMPEFPGVEQAVRGIFHPENIEVRHDLNWGTWRVKL